MQTRYFALVFGLLYGLSGVLGLIPGLVTPPAPDDPALAVGAMHGRLLGIFPFNLLHALVHILVGVWGVVAYRTWRASRSFAQAMTVAFAGLFVLGLIPGANTLFGLVPLHGSDIWLHGLTALVSAYFGFYVREPSAAGKYTATVTR